MHLTFDKMVVQNWVWPIEYDSESLNRTVAGSNFDPTLFLYAFEGSRMVGHANAWQVETPAYGEKTATLFFPRTFPGHETAREPLVEALCENLRALGIRRIQIWGCSMWPGSCQWNEAHGVHESADRPRGYKLYMTCDIANPDLDVPNDWVHPVMSDGDRTEAAQLARIWYRYPLDQSRELIQRRELEAIAHLQVRQGDRVTGSCLVARNDVRPSLAAIYSIYVENAQALRQLIAQGVRECRAADVEKLLVDLIYEHRHFQPTYEDLGFVREAE